MFFNCAEPSILLHSRKLVFPQYNITSMAEKVDPKALKQPKDIVAQDRNWTLRVNNELTAEQKWSNQWGFYEKGKLPSTQASLPKRPRQRRRRQSMIESSSWSRKLTRSTEKCSRPPHRPMAKATRWRSSRMESTASMKTTISGHCNADCRRAGRSPSGLLVLLIIFSRGPLRPSLQDEQEEVSRQ